MRTESFDVIVVGAGAAGLMCAGVAARRGRRVLLLEHTRSVGAKILISGGGRCNFTNLDIRPDRFVSDNPHFAKSALARYTQHDFLGLVGRYAIPHYEKTLGQLFCEGVGSARLIVDMLVKECDGVDIRTGVAITSLARAENTFEIATPQCMLRSSALVIATGGLSIPKLGATDFAYQVARQFAVPIVTPRPALVPLTFSSQDRTWMTALSGVSVEARVAHGKANFREGLLFTHRGLSGPSILQISTYWRPGDAIAIDFLPEASLDALLLQMKKERPKIQIATALRSHLPERLTNALLALPRHGDAAAHIDANLGDFRDNVLRDLGKSINHFTVTPDGDEGYAKAEVTAGGVDTKALSSRTMGVTAVAGLYFIGEAVDVTGWLGGYNFQWAWSSGWAAGMAV